MQISGPSDGYSGKVNIDNTDEEVTQGLDDLGERLELFKSKGARFAKWRALYQISEVTPSDLLIESNAHQLACYAALCQTHGLVPIVEPEVLIDGEHTIKACAEVSEKVLHAVFHELHKHRVLLEGIILKPSMVMPGKNAKNKSTPEEVAHHTLEVFRRVVPAAVPTINFLSGGQTPEEATYNLNAMNANPQPWRLSFSYARALQGPCMEAWRGQDNQIQKAQEALLERARLNSLASEGK